MLLLLEVSKHCLLLLLLMDQLLCHFVLPLYLSTLLLFFFLVLTLLSSCLILNSFSDFSFRYTMVSAPNLLVLFSFFQASSLTSLPTTLFLVSPTFSRALTLISSACFFSFSALGLISFANLSLQPRLSHIFLQLLHQTLRAHHLLFRWPCLLLQPFFCVS